MTLIQADSSTFKQLFSNKRYEVPEFQRVFAWKKTHMNDFWEDLNEAMNKKSFDSALKKANISDFRFHDLRHTYAMAGIDLKTVSELWGHSSV
ncbi:MAG: DUF262 domain-containing protein [Candidatus Ancaeobacter aquaticus]|nr:DUF262 domain-containing protein [Candidatus Ancaeobacter aquaticus]